MLPTRTADLLTRVLVQGVVDHAQDVGPFCNERFHQNSEEAIGDKVSVPSPLAEESVDGGEVLGFMEPHGQNRLADGVLAHRQHPSDQERYKDTETRCAETVFETNLVYRKRLWYTSVHSAFLLPGSLQFTKPGMRGTPYFFNCFSLTNRITNQKGRNYRLINRGRTASCPTALSRIPACDILAPGSSVLLAAARAEVITGGEAELGRAAG